MRVVAALLLLAMLAGCGQKGPLYRPDDAGDEAPREREGDRREARQS